MSPSIPDTLWVTARPSHRTVMNPKWNAGIRSAHVAVVELERHPSEGRADAAAASVA
ncbi:MAG TPA: hypothetical protein VNG12_03740 [Acidimicrobiales bacterium]|nr:hypothetical protein [Acidimicrobiales bacterium]